MKFFITLIFIILTFCESIAQVGGESAFSFLNIPVSARTGALGGSAIAIKDEDPNFALDNPSLLSAEMSSALSFTYLNYFADVNLGHFSYTHDFKKYGTFSGGVKYINYGNFLETDEGGNELGSFSASDYAFILGWGKSIDTSFSVGANLKPIYSKFYQYSSFAMAMDLSATYHNAKKQLTTALLIKNIGRQFSTYIEERDTEPLPFEVQLGISKKLAHTPIRFNVDFIHLNNWNLAYNDSSSVTNRDNTLDDEARKELNKTGMVSEFFRHVVVGTEFVLSPSFMLRFGYNFQRRAELAFDNKGGLIGFSWGLGFRIKKIHVSYGGASYHLAGTSNHFTITTTISDYYKKNQVVIPEEKTSKKSRNRKKDKQSEE